MAHTKKATLKIPELRPDEKNFTDDHDSPIAAHHLVVTVNGAEVVNTVLGLDQLTYVVGGVPAGSNLQVDLSDVAADGHEGLPNSRSAQAPPEPKPIPVPDAVEITFEDEPHEHDE